MSYRDPASGEEGTKDLDRNSQVRTAEVSSRKKMNCALNTPWRVEQGTNEAGRLRSVALFVFLARSAGARIVAADFIVAALDWLRRDRFFAPIQGELRLRA